MKILFHKMIVIPLITLLSLFITPIVNAWSLDDLKCTDGAYTGYITGLSIGYFNNSPTDDHIVLIFRPDDKKDQPGRVVLTDPNYSKPAGPAFLSIAQTALLTGQKVEMWCDGTWINGIWLGEGAGIPGGAGSGKILRYGLSGGFQE
ncbi:hypothetical protein [Xenorhabdus japonica]|uniref:Uncharacterized protein n=1 Tax=Xenorhabdus japonica TaxID=53341 RepID=A0A1I5DDV2_9GAMM|nr:hypothetical protein [Xenorhabdus japonica]SFN97429.1 hypothetical protein SAMN05421579_13911 [Xenorhabdus japonica]